MTDRVSASASTYPPRASGDSGILRCSSLFDPRQGKLLADVSVEIEGGRVVGVTADTAATDCTKSSGWQISVGSDCTVIPGLIECHNHLQLCPSRVADPREDWLRSSDRALLERMLCNSAKALHAGITTIRDCGAGRHLDTLFLRRIREAGLIAPRVLFAGLPIMAREGHLAWMGREVSGPADAAAAVREQHEGGADFIKVTASGGMISGAAGIRSLFLSKEELRSLADQAHELGMRITAHAHSTEAIEAVAIAGFDMIEHCCWLGRDGLRYKKDVARLIADSGIVVVPTNAAFYPHGRTKLQWQALLGSQVERIGIVAEMLATGIGMVTGADDQEFNTVAHEAALLVEAGLDPVDALRAATLWAAKALGVEQDCGSVEPGKVADIVVVRGNPLVAVEALREVVAVVAQGHVVRQIEETANRTEKW